VLKFKCPAPGPKGSKVKLTLYILFRLFHEYSLPEERAGVPWETSNKVIPCIHTSPPLTPPIFKCLSLLQCSLSSSLGLNWLKVHQCSIIIFICKFALQKQTGEAWELSKKQCFFGYPEALDRKVFASLLHRLPVLLFFPVSINPPMLYTHLHLYAALTRRTSG